MTVCTSDPELLVVTLLAVRPALVSHVLAVEENLAGGALEAPDVVLLVQGHQGLTVPQVLATARTLVLPDLTPGTGPGTGDPDTRDGHVRARPAHIGFINLENSKICIYMII